MNEQKKLEEKYLSKRKEVQKLVKAQITIYERKETKEVKENGTKLWENIDRLRNNTTKRNESVQLYNDQGVKLGREEAKTELIKFWKDIYGRHENNISKAWNNVERLEYVQNQREEQETLELTTGHKIPRNLREHYDMVFPIEGRTKRMVEPKLDRNKLIECLKRLRSGKAAGPDGLQPEYYKTLLNSEIYTNTLLDCYKTELERKRKPKEWKTLKIKMTEKKKKNNSKRLKAHSTNKCFLQNIYVPYER